MTNPPPPLPDTYWVVPNRFLAGPNPLRMPGIRPDQTIQALVAAGINAFIDLTDSYEMMGVSYLPLIKNRSDHQDIRYFNHPIQDFGIPTRAAMLQVLDVINQMMNEGRKLYLHCYGGIGRTGTVVGCYLVEQGFTGNQALTQIIAMRQNLGRIWIPSPETDEQMEFVLSWKGNK
jgi:protein-tyrosine phosphatase